MVRSKKMIAFLALAVGLFLAWGTLVEGQTGFKLIVNESNQVEQLSKNDVSKFFLKKATRWPDGATKVEPVDQDDSSSVRETFSLEVHGRSVNAIKSYWQRQIFSGRGTPPLERSNDREVMSYVSSTTGAIGYVSSSTALGSGVREVRVVE